MAETCGAHTKRGGVCKNPAGFKTDHVGIGRCHLHGGRTETHRKNAQEQLARQAVAAYGLPREVDPHTALLEELWRTAGHVAWLRGRIADLGDDELHGPVGTSGFTESGAEHHPREEPHIWVRLYQEERRHLASVARDCIRAGIEERRVTLAEALGEEIAAFGRGLLAEFGIDPTSKEARRAFRKLLGGRNSA